MNRLLASLQAFLREWRRQSWLKARRDSINLPF
jgi:hypothetical protein